MTPAGSRSERLALPAHRTLTTHRVSVGTLTLDSRCPALETR